MSTRITLIATAGPLAGQEYVFTDHTFCLIGRSSDCHIQLPGGDGFALTASRRHCLLDIDPPRVWVRDLGSLNGTFVNGKNIGQRARGQTADEAVRLDFAEQMLHDGDELRVGATVFRITIADSADDVGRWPETAHACAVCG